MANISTPILIIGAGPAGLSASALLARYGIGTLTVTRHPTVANSPRAHITNQRTLEVFRDLGIEGAVVAAATPNSLMLNNVWATSFAGAELARLEAWGAGELRRADYARASPCTMCNIPQHVLEPILQQAAQDAGANFLFNTEVKEITQDDGKVSALLVDRANGMQTVVQAQYAIGADGGNSLVARSIGVEFEGEMGLATYASCWLEADLAPYCAHRPGVLYWLSQPDPQFGLCMGTFICVKPWSEWVMSFFCDPASGPEQLSEEAIIARARTLIGDSSVAVKIKSVNRWHANQMVAKSMASGRIFLAGDAAHRHTPMNGLGTNTSVQDSFNLAWKLAMVLRKQASPALLDTYTAERQPVARQVVGRATRSGEEMRNFMAAFDILPDGRPAAAYQARIEELSSNTEQGRLRRAGADAALERMHYALNCHGVELGQRYASHAVHPDAMPAIVPERDPELYFSPSTVPGASLPHAWLEYRGKQVSTLDLAGHGRFTLLTGLSGGAWKTAAEEAARLLGIELDTFAIGPGCEVLDPYRSWARLREVEESGCVLVRPDRFILWRAQRHAGDASRLLQSILSAALWPDGIGRAAEAA